MRAERICVGDSRYGVQLTMCKGKQGLPRIPNPNSFEPIICMTPFHSVLLPIHYLQVEDYAFKDRCLIERMCSDKEMELISTTE